MQNARLFGALARAGMVMVGEKAGGNRQTDSHQQTPYRSITVAQQALQGAS